MENDSGECVAKKMKLSTNLPEPCIQMRNSGIFKLNDHCLLKILRYLDLWEVTDVLQSDPRFRNSVEMRVTPKELEYISKEFWAIPEFKEVFAKKVTHFCANKLHSFAISKNFSWFENLEGLDIRELQFRSLKVQEIASFPSKLKYLAIQNEKLPKDCLIKWFQILNPTLIELNCNFISFYNFPDALKELNNLETLTLEGFTSNHNISIHKYLIDNCIIQNKNLLNLRILPQSSEIESAITFDALSALTQLKSLTMKNVALDSWYEIFQLPCKNLRQLTLLNSRSKQTGKDPKDQITRKLGEVYQSLRVYIE